MEKKITNGNVRMLIEVIDEVEASNDITMGVKTLYSLAKNRAKLMSKDKVIEKVRLKLVEKHGKKGEDGVTKVEDGKIEAFQKDWFDLLGEEVSVDFYTIGIDDFEKSVGRIGGVKNLHLLFDYIVSDDEIKKPNENHKGEKQEAEVEKS